MTTLSKKLHNDKHGDKNSSQKHAQPLYQQIRDELRQRILSGVYGVHDKLPSEANLMQEFGVSRITVRQALRDMHREGYLFSTQGKGTFVRKPKAIQDVQSLQGFDEAMRRQGYTTSARVLNIAEVTPNNDVAVALQLSQTQTVVEVRRVRYLNHKPVSVDVSYFPREIGARLWGRDLSVDIFPMLENELDIPLGHASLTLGAAACTPELALLLDLEAQSPILQVQRLTHDKNNTPIDFEYLSYRGDAFQYHFRIDRQRD